MLQHIRLAMQRGLWGGKMNNPEMAITTKHRRFMNLDILYAVSQAVAVFFGVVALLSGMVVNKRQATQLLMLQSSADDSKTEQERVGILLAEAKTKQAQAEKELLALQSLIQSQRHVDSMAMSAVLQAGPKGSAKVLYVDGNEEAYGLAMNLHHLLASNGWKVSALEPAIGRQPPITGIHVEAGGDLEMKLPKDEPKDGEPTIPEFGEPANTLSKALRAGKIPGALGFGGDFGKGPSHLAPGEFILTVGPKY